MKPEEQRMAKSVEASKKFVEAKTAMDVIHRMYGYGKSKCSRIAQGVDPKVVSIYNKLMKTEDKDAAAELRSQLAKALESKPVKKAE